MKKAYKTELYLSEDQKNSINRAIGVCRFLYNRFIGYNKDNYEAYKAGQEEKGYISGYDFDKYVNNELSKEEGYEWIKEVSSKARKQSIMDAHRSFQNFFKGLSRFPKFKKKSNQDVKMYLPKNNKGDWKVERHRVKIPTIGWVRLKEFGYIPVNGDVISGTISHKAGRYYVSVLCEEENKEIVRENNDNEGIGLDLGINYFVVSSDGNKFKNINKGERVRKIEKKLRREQRSLSRKYEMEKKEEVRGKRSNINKNVLRVQKLHERLRNIREEYVRGVVDMLVKTKPAYIVIEDLNVRGMLKNKHVADAVSKQKFYRFREWLGYKCKEQGIELRIVDRYYASSKLCSGCGSKKKDLKWRDRVYRCTECGIEVDRDENASKNLVRARDYKVV